MKHTALSSGSRQPLLPTHQLFLHSVSPHCHRITFYFGSTHLKPIPGPEILPEAPSPNPDAMGGGFNML